MNINGVFALFISLITLNFVFILSMKCYGADYFFQIITLIFDLIIPILVYYGAIRCRRI